MRIAPVLLHAGWDCPLVGEQVQVIIQRYQSVKISRPQMQLFADVVATNSLLNTGDKNTVLCNRSSRH